MRIELLWVFIFHEELLHLGTLREAWSVSVCVKVIASTKGTKELKSTRITEVMISISLLCSRTKRVLKYGTLFHWDVLYIDDAWIWSCIYFELVIWVVFLRQWYIYIYDGKARQLAVMSSSSILHTVSLKTWTAELIPVLSKELQIIGHTLGGPLWLGDCSTQGKQRQWSKLFTIPLIFYWLQCKKLLAGTMTEFCSLCD